MQYQMTAEMWEEKITAWYAEHRGIARYNIIILISPVPKLLNYTLAPGVSLPTWQMRCVAVNAN